MLGSRSHSSQEKFDKSIPYCAGNGTTNFNCAARFAQHPERLPSEHPRFFDKIICRHIALDAALLRRKYNDIKFDGGPRAPRHFKEFLESRYASPERIQKNIPYAVEKRYEEFISHAKERSMVHENFLGEFLKDEFKQLRAGESKQLLLLTGNHAMTLDLKVKHKRGRDVYVVSLFDPNLTLAHERVAMRKLSDVENWTFESFRDKRVIERYKGKILTMLAIPDDFSLKRPHRRTRPNQRQHFDYLSGKESPKELHQLFFNGMPLDRLKDALHHCHNATERMQWLKAEGRFGHPGLFYAMLRGHARTVRHFGELLQELQQDRKITNKEIYTLVKSTRKGGCPAAYQALLYGNTETIQAYGDMLLDLQYSGALTHKQVAKLMSGKLDGFPFWGNLFRKSGRQQAEQRGRYKTVQACDEILRESARIAPKRGG